MYERSLFVFRRDLRLQDNTGLCRAIQASKTVLPVFIFDPRQAKNKENKYFSPNAFQFLIESLRELTAQIEERGGSLFFFEGKPGSVLSRLVRMGGYEAVFANRDYTPFARRRDEKLQEEIENAGATFHLSDDALLTSPESVLSEEGEPFFVYSHFKQAARAVPIDDPEPLGRPSFEQALLPSSASADAAGLPRCTLDDYDRYYNGDLAVSGGRSDGEARLDSLDGFRYYSRKRHRLDDYTVTGLSAHLKFGTVSPREVFAEIKDRYNVRHKLISQLFWRDFYTQFAYHFPSVFGRAVRPKDRYIDWRSNEEDWERWCHGKTGVPIVDAGMRELRSTGYMHNRARMTVASFLSKHLLIDWRRGEKYFAQHLVDYDPSVNNGNWQWSASVGLDSVPFRMFNPYSQAEKHDKGAAYIRRWVPSLQDVDPDVLTSGEVIDLSRFADYPRPVVNHYPAHRRAKYIYKSAQESAQEAGYGRYDVSANLS